MNKNHAHTNRTSGSNGRGMHSQFISDDIAFLNWNTNRTPFISALALLFFLILPTGAVTTAPMNLNETDSNTSFHDAHKNFRNNQK